MYSRSRYRGKSRTSVKGKSQEYKKKNIENRHRHTGKQPSHVNLQGGGVRGLSTAIRNVREQAAGQGT